MIREAHRDEIEEIVRLMVQFEQASSFVRVDYDYTVKSYHHFADRGIWFEFVLEDDTGKRIGGLGGIIGPDIHNGTMLAIETHWFVEPEHRGKGLSLLRHFEEWAEGKGYLPVMIHLSDSYPEALKKVYERRGYRLLENHYIKGAIK
jgi:GNAT superfamily N-acetyltransferase